MGKDYIIHLNNQMNFISKINAGICLKELMYLDYEYPPLFYAIAWLLKYITGAYQAMFLISSMFLTMLLLSVYGVGKTLGNRVVGIIAAYICSFFPFIYKTSIQFNLELSTAALSSLIIYLMLRVGEGNRLIYKILLILAIVAAGLTRQLIILFVIGPLMCYSLNCFHNRENVKKSHNIRDVWAALIISFVILLIAYYHDLNTFDRLIGKVDERGLIDSGEVTLLYHAFYYIKAIPGQLSWAYTICFIMALGFVFKLGEYSTNMFLAWFIPPLVVLTCVYNKFPEFTIGNLPVIALIIALAVDKVKSVKLKSIIAVGVVVVGVCQYFNNF
ncbi:MAG: glycosyltransferase family 39 protein [Candidatus Omnitrophica bacterium]|nr:glycosyltransferase family 39 protein [Candidatus Omnitrophota bacterium]MBU4477867.1 glycosyltransferase family 39 protein [Candidatus Omnitrophota bacterium]MCG2704139.1 glycosyltransferase family 39 protein [Candidatus Omnitrophota bacterium]